MGESGAHIKLVNKLCDWILETYLDGDTGYLLVDLPDSNLYEKPPKINNFIPDVYVPYNSEDILIIGEAKTAKDIEKVHTIRQIKAFLRKCAMNEKSIFILAVPWHIVRRAESILKKLKTQVGAQCVKTIVLKDLPG